MYRVVVEKVPDHEIAQHLLDNLRKATHSIGCVVFYQAQESTDVYRELEETKQKLAETEVGLQNAKDLIARLDKGQRGV